MSYNAIHIKIGIARQRICYKLAWDEDTYNNMQLDYAAAYLTQVIGCDVEVRDKLMSKRLFWMWWANHWASRDKHFLRTYANIERTRNDLRHIYEGVHSIYELQCRPNRIILEDSYAELLDELFQKEVS